MCTASVYHAWTKQWTNSAHDLTVDHSSCWVSLGLYICTPIILVQRPINSGLIIDLWIMPFRSKTSKVVKSGGSCSLVAEQWHGMPVGLGSIPGSSTFLSYSFAISEVFRRNGMIQRSTIRPGYDNMEMDQNNWSPNNRTPSYDSVQILNNNVYACIILYMCELQELHESPHTPNCIADWG